MNVAASFRLESVLVEGRVRPRLRDVDLVLHDGVVAVLGDSGAGKTTLLEVLVGFLSPQRGRVERPGAVRGTVPSYWVPSSGALWPHRTVHEHVVGVAPEGMAAEAAEYLERLGLAAFRDRRPATLSDGQRARLSLARALATRAPALFLDEALAHVDLLHREVAYELLFEARDRGCLIVLTTHDGREALALAERCVVLAEGAVVFDGPTRTLEEDPPRAAGARVLGPVLGMDETRRERFLGEDRGSSWVRPNRLALAPEEGGPLEVVRSETRGASRRVKLRHRASGDEQSFDLERSAARANEGTRARLLRLCLLFAALLLCRCSGEDVPTLEFRSVRTVSLPPEGPKTPAPRGLARTRAGELLVLDTIGRVLRFDAEGRFVTFWWMPEFEVGRPEGVVELADGRIAVADTHYHRVVVFHPDGHVQSMFGREGTGPGEFLYPVKLVEDPSGVLYVAEYGSNDRVQRFSADGEYLGAFGSCGTEPGQFQRTSGLAWHDGKIYVADAVNHRIQVFTDEGLFLEVLGGVEPVALSFPYDLCLDDEGRLVTVEYDASRVSVLGLDGEWIGSYGRAGRDLGSFHTPWGVRAMAGGRIWVADTGNRRLVELVP